MIKVCEYCGKEFTSSQPLARFDTFSCKRKAKRLRDGMKPQTKEIVYVVRDSGSDTFSKRWEVLSKLIPKITKLEDLAPLMYEIELRLSIK